MVSYKIILDTKACIGSAQCEALSPAFWKMAGAKVPQLTGGKPGTQPNTVEATIPESEYKNQKLVAESCPSAAIKIVRVD